MEGILILAAILCLQEAFKLIATLLNMDVGDAD